MGFLTPVIGVRWLGKQWGIQIGEGQGPRRCYMALTSHPPVPRVRLLTAPREERGRNNGEEDGRDQEMGLKISERIFENTEGEILEESAASLVKKKQPNAWLGRRHTLEAKKKIGAANKGNVPWNRGIHWSEEIRKRISIGTKLAMQRPEVRAKLREWAKSRRHNLETREKIRMGSFRALVNRRRKALQEHGFPRKTHRMKLPFPITSREVIENLNNAANARVRELTERKEAEKTKSPSQPKAPMSEAAKDKVRKKVLELWADPLYRERVREGRLRYYSRSGPRSLSENHRKKISETLRKKHAESEKLRRSSQSSHGTEEKHEKRSRQRQVDSIAGERLRRFRRKQRRKELREREKELERRKQEELRREENLALLKNLKEAGVLPPLEDDGPGEQWDIRDETSELDTGDSEHDSSQQSNTFRLVDSIFKENGLPFAAPIMISNYEYNRDIKPLPRRKHSVRTIRYQNGEEIIVEEESLLS